MFFSYQSANASQWWSQNLRDHLTSLDTSFSNTFASTMLGACRAEKIKYKHIETAVVEKRRLRVESMNSERLPSVFVLKTDHKKIIAAPLMFVLPGAFTTTKSPQAVRMARSFNKMGYHSVTLPNPWGLEFITERPYFVMGFFVKEGEALYAAMREAYHNLKLRGLINGKV